MRVIYNGVDLMVQETVRYDMEPVYDDSGTDYLYTRHTGVFRALVNGGAHVIFGTLVNGAFTRNGPFISYTSDGDAVLTGDPTGGVRQLRPADMTIPRPSWTANNVGSTGSQQSIFGGIFREEAPLAVGSMPAGVGTSEARKSIYANIVPAPNAAIYSAIEIRRRLMMPRGNLTILSGAWGVAPGAIVLPFEVFLVSPIPGMMTDCKNGPSPRVLSITQALGDATTFVVEFAIETYVNEAESLGVRNTGPLLSNRFSQTQTILEDGSTVINTQGQALFRTDLLIALRQSPDTHRPVLFLPIPIGFIRGNITVHGMEDVTGVQYAFTDKQVPVNFAAGPYAKAAHIAAVHRQAITAGDDILKGALATYERVLGLTVNRRLAASEKAGMGGGGGTGSAIIR